MDIKYPLDFNAFLKNMYAKYFVPRKDQKDAVIFELSNYQKKLEKLGKKDIANAYKKLALGLRNMNQLSALQHLEAAEKLSIDALSTTLSPLLQIKLLQIGVVSIVTRHEISGLNVKETRQLCAAWLQHLNGVHTRALREIVKRQIRGLTFSDLLGRFSTWAAHWLLPCRRVSHEEVEEAQDCYILIELARLCITVFRYFKDAAAFHDSFHLVIARRLGKPPYVVSVSFLLLDVADDVFKRQIVHQGNPWFHQRLFLYMIETVEFAVESLGDQNGSPWRTDRRWQTNRDILKEVRRRRFVPCVVLSDYQSPPSETWPIRIRKGDEMELIAVGYPDGTVTVRRSEEEFGHFVAKECLNYTEAEKTFTLMMRQIISRE